MQVSVLYRKRQMFSVEASVYCTIGRALLGLVNAPLNSFDSRKEDEKKGIPCGNTFCSIELGEECVAGKICGCPKGQKRKDASSPCRAVESWNLPLYVIRDGHNKITYSPSLANPLNDEHKDLVSRFETGVSQSYDKTPLKSAFVTAEVNEIENPETRKKSWDTGILYNFTSHFVKGSVAEPSAVFTDLIDYIQKRNNFEVGKGKCAPLITGGIAGRKVEIVHFARTIESVLELLSLGLSSGCHLQGSRKGIHVS